MSSTPRPRAPCCALIAALALLAACATGVGQQNGDGGGPGPDGSVGGDGTTNGPVIGVSPYALTFADAAQGAPQTETVTITNLGQGTLNLLSISLTENDSNLEFTYVDPSSTTLASGESATVDVTLTPTDDELDLGTLVIESNDPATPVVTVDLFSSWIGTPDLTVCIETGQPAPGNCEDPLVVDFGLVDYGAQTQRTFFARNDGDGNVTITVQEALVETGSSSHDPLYTIDLFTMVETPPGSGNWVETPAILPHPLVASTGAVPDPDALYGRITFTANTDGFLILSGDILKITTTETGDETPRDTGVPITATINGCPPGLYDQNGNPTDGCEYGCTVTNGGVEACDGLDNDCDGTTDGMTEPCYTGGDNGCDANGQNCEGICQPGTHTCTAGSWGICQGQVVGQTEVCDDLDNNCNGQTTEGLDEGGNSCGSAIPVTAVSDTSCQTQSFSGTITTHDNDVDWYNVTFSSGSNNSLTFNAKLEFTAPVGGGNFLMDIFKADCSTTADCDQGSYLGRTLYQWDINSAGRCPGNQSCSHAQYLRVKVYKVGGPACESYTIQASNGCP
ncbi:MAG: choice-of-anchor D domain-containing protein [bacterium]